MIKTILNKLIMVLYFVFSALLLEAVAFKILNLGFMPTYFGYNLAIILAIALFVFIVPNYTAQYVIYTIILLIQTILIYVNYSLYVIYGDLFSIDMMALGGEAMAAMTTNFIYFSVIFQLISVFLAISIIGAILLKCSKKENMNVKYHFSIFNVIIMIIVQCFACGYYINIRENINANARIDNTSYIYSDAFLMNTAYLKANSYEKYGTYGYFTNLIFNNFSDNNEAFKQATIDYMNSGNIYNGSYYNEHNELCSNGMFGTAKDQNVIVIMMESLEWFGYGDGTYDYGLENILSDDTLTKNISSMIDSDSTMIASNFFAKSKTNYSEAFSILGLYPVGQSLNDIAGDNFNSTTNAFGYTLPNVLKEEGYTTSYIHSNEINFYSRSKTHKNLGFDVVVGKDGIKKDGKSIYTGDDLKWNHWACEGDLTRNAINYIIPTNYKEKNFYSFFLNVSSHGPYLYDTNDGDCMRYINYIMYGEDDCIQNPDTKIWEIKDTTNCTFDSLTGKWNKGTNSTLTYTTWYQNILDKFSTLDPSLINELLYYQCGVMGLDESVGVIVQQLKDYGIYDDTTIVMYSDHYAYYDGLSNRMKGFDTSDVTSVELNTIPMWIHSSAIKEYANTRYPNRTTKYLTYDRFCSAYDIIPTVLDMLGVEYNENLYLGQSLFSPADNRYRVGDEYRDMTVYYSNTGGIFSECMYTYDLRTIYYTKEGVDSDAEEIFRNEVAKLLIKINYLGILNDYKLYNQLDVV